MHARQSVTSARETEPAGNPEKSNTSRACFGFEAFDAPAFVTDFDATAAFDFVTPEAFAFEAFDGTDFLLAAAVFFDAGFFEAFAAAGLLPAAFFTFDAAGFFAAFLTAGFAFFAAVFDLVLVAAI
jgi:hypothetical protein